MKDSVLAIIDKVMEHNPKFVEFTQLVIAISSILEARNTNGISNHLDYLVEVRTSLKTDIDDDKVQHCLIIIRGLDSHSIKSPFSIQKK